MHQNSVSVLREKQNEELVKPFLARGSKLSRCPACLLVEHHCICDFRSEVGSNCAFCFIFYQGEVLKPSNTGRLIADLIADNYAFQWQRTEVEPALSSLLSNKHYVPIVVFPHEYAKVGQCISSLDELTEFSGQGEKRKPLFIILDGTWREAKKMFRSAYLSAFPVLGIDPDEVSNYQLRESSHKYQLCTAEVGIEVLRLAGDMHASQALTDYFTLFRERYLASKANVVLT